MTGKANESSIEIIPLVGGHTKSSLDTKSNKSINGGLGFFGAVLAFLSTIVGGGTVGLPFAFYWAGIPFGIILNIIVGGLTAYSCYIYLLTKDLTGGLE
jgi:hypothetical protein